MQVIFELFFSTFDQIWKKWRDKKLQAPIANQQKNPYYSLPNDLVLSLVKYMDIWKGKQINQNYPLVKLEWLCLICRTTFSSRRKTAQPFFVSSVETP